MIDSSQFQLTVFYESLVFVNMKSIAKYETKIIYYGWVCIC